MIYPIVRLYDSTERALAAVRSLQKAGFREDDIDLVTSASTAPPGAGSEDPITARIAAGYVLKSKARIYADGVRRGGSLVIVRAHLGSGRLATKLLERQSPIDAGVPLVEDPAPQWDEAAPFSSMLQLPVKVNSTAPFSAFWVLPVLTKRRTICSLLGLPELTQRGWTFSQALGLPLLSRRSTPFSSMFGLPLLTGRR